jgi:hypothetical protein
MQPKNPDDKFYEDHGVVPPERTGHGTEQDIQRIMTTPTKHGQWQQRGNLIVCMACPHHHASPIPTDRILIGTDQKTGLPILEKIDIK